MGSGQDLQKNFKDVEISKAQPEANFKGSPLEHKNSDHLDYHGNTEMGKKKWGTFPQEVPMTLGWNRTFCPYNSHS